MEPEKTATQARKHGDLKITASASLAAHKGDGGRGGLPLGATTNGARRLAELLLQAIDEVVECRIALLIGGSSTPLQPFKGIVHSCPLCHQS